MCIIRSESDRYILSLYCHLIVLLQRIIHLCKLLNKPEEVVQRKLQGFLSVESLSDMATGPLEDGLANLGCNGTPNDRSDPVVNGRLPAEVISIDVLLVTCCHDMTFMESIVFCLHWICHCSQFSLNSPF